MEGMGIWIFLLLFYLLQALTKRKQKQNRQKQTDAPSQKTQRVPNSRKK
jgi:preprotein translocase subunit YajC